MAARARVPQFGDWENENDVPYTVYFDNARKGRGGKIINPNDPQENPDLFRQIATPAPSGSRPQTAESVGRGAVRPPPHERRESRENGNFRQSVNSPARTDNIGRRTAIESPHRHYGHGSPSSRPTRQSVGSEHSFEQSPIHSRHPAKVSGRGGTSPAGDGKNSYDSSHGTHGRSRLKPVTRVDESPDRGAAVPRFGDWNEKNPQSSDNYTHIFNQVREGKHTVHSNLPAGNKFESSHHVMQKQNTRENRKPWKRVRWKCGGSFITCFAVPSARYAEIPDFVLAKWLP